MFQSKTFELFRRTGRQRRQHVRSLRRLSPLLSSFALSAFRASPRPRFSPKERLRREAGRVCASVPDLGQLHRAGVVYGAKNQIGLLPGFLSFLIVN